MRKFVGFFNRPAGRAVRYLVSIALLAGFMVSIDWSRLAQTHGRFDRGLVALALVLAGVTYPLHAWRWWLLLRAQRVGLTFHWTHVVTWIGQFYNSFLLGGIGGDAARIYYLYRDRPTRVPGGLASIVLDRVMGLVVLMTLAVVALIAKAGALAHEPTLQWIFFASLAVTAGGALAAAVMLVTEPHRWPHWTHRLLRPKGIATATDLLGGVRGHRWDHAVALIISGIIWLLDIIAIWLIARSIGLHLPMLETCIAVAVAYAATALPISVGGHGVREGALLAVLGMFGLISAAGQLDAALLLAVLAWGLTIFWSLFGGGVLLLAPRLLPLAANTVATTPLRAAAPVSPAGPSV
jgi:glycosyltransferase 2 family protein